MHTCGDRTEAFTPTAFGSLAHLDFFPSLAFFTSAGAHTMHACEYRLMEPPLCWLKNVFLSYLHHALAFFSSLRLCECIRRSAIIIFRTLCCTLQLPRKKRIRCYCCATSAWVWWGAANKLLWTTGKKILTAILRSIACGRLRNALKTAFKIYNYEYCEFS